MNTPIVQAILPTTGLNGLAAASASLGSAISAQTTDLGILFAIHLAGAQSLSAESAFHTDSSTVESGNILPLTGAEILSLGNELPPMLVGDQPIQQTWQNRGEEDGATTDVLSQLQMILNEGSELPVVRPLPVSFAQVATQSPELADAAVAGAAVKANAGRSFQWADPTETATLEVELPPGFSLAKAGYLATDVALAAQMATSQPVPRQAATNGLEVALAQTMQPAADAEAVDMMLPDKALNQIQSAPFSSLLREAAEPQQTSPSPRTVDVPLAKHGWDQTLSKQVGLLINQQVQTAEIKLNPAHLGPLEVKISMDGDQANLVFVSQHAQVREALESAMPRLREMLGDTGLNLGNVDVSAHGQSGRSHENGEPRQGSAFANAMQQEGGGATADEGEGETAKLLAASSLVDYYA